MFSRPWSAHGLQRRQAVLQVHHSVRVIPGRPGAAPWAPSTPTPLASATS